MHLLVKKNFDDKCSFYYWLCNLSQILYIQSIARNMVKVKTTPYKFLDTPWGFQDFKIVGAWMWWCQPYAPAPFTPQEIFLVLISLRSWVESQAHSAAGGTMSIKSSNDTIGNRTRDLSDCSDVILYYRLMMHGNSNIKYSICISLKL